MTPRVWTVSNIGDVNVKLYLNCSRITFAASLALIGAPALAQTGPNDDTVIVTGTLTPLPAEKVGQTITVISGDLIEDQGYNHLPDVLRQVPSVAVSQPGALSGGQTVVTEKATIDIKQEPGKLIQLAAAAQLTDVVKALNSLGATPQDLLAILQAIKAAGALNAELEVI